MPKTCKNNALNVEYCSYKGLTHNEIIVTIMEITLNIVLIKD